MRQARALGVRGRPTRPGAGLDFLHPVAGTHRVTSFPELSKKPESPALHFRLYQWVCLGLLARFGQRLNMRLQRERPPVLLYPTYLVTEKSHGVVGLTLGPKTSIMRLGDLPERASQ